MNSTDFATLVRKKTGTSTTTFPDSELLLYANTYMDEIAGRIQQFRPYVWNMPFTGDLEEDQREYAFPEEVLNNIVSLELKFSTSGKFVPARALKQAPPNLPLTEEHITAEYDNENPAYFVRRKAFFILSGSIPDVVAGFTLVANVFPKHLEALDGSDDMSIDPSTTEHGFPREFHELLARRVAIQFKDIHGKKLSREDLRYEVDLEEKLEEFSTDNLATQEIAAVPNSASMADHGYNY